MSCVTGCGSKLTNSLGQTELTNSLGQTELTNSLGKQSSQTPSGKQNSQTPSGNNNMNFWLTHYQVLFLETAANLRVSRGKADNFLQRFFYFRVGGTCITKHLMTGPVGNSEICFHSISMFPSASPWETLRVSGNKKQNLLFPLGPGIMCLLHTVCRINISFNATTSN